LDSPTRSRLESPSAWRPRRCAAASVSPPTRRR
jgi:hypothetical protein